MRKHIYKLIVLVFILVLGFLFLKGIMYNKEVNDNGVATVAKFLYYKQFPKTDNYYFKYFANGKEYVNEYGKTMSNFYKNKGKFYEIKYSKKDPNKLIVNFDKEITDTVAILNAGFLREEIER